MAIIPGKVAVALSGGIDSAVAAALLLQQGWEVSGVYLRLAPEPAASPHLDALCRHLGIECVSLDWRQEFQDEIISYFAALYRAGKTPNPCVRCNERIKFGRLLPLIRSWGCDYLATGHYARIEIRSDGSPALRRGVDREKEQSYFLHRLRPAFLGSILLPLGDWTKQGVREKSSALGLDQFLPHRESQELCFVKGNYPDFIRELGFPGLNRPGPIVTRQGKTVGRHRGLEHYTVGQRRGLGVPGPAPYYVVELDQAANRIVVGFKEELRSAGLEVEDINWLRPVPAEPLRAEVKLRYRHPGAGCLITPLSHTRAWVSLDQPQTAITPGQAAVFYQGELVLGGGWIVRGDAP